MATVPHAYEQDTRIEFTRHNYELVTLIVLTGATMIARKGVAASGRPAKKIQWLAGKRDYFEQFILGQLRCVIHRHPFNRVIREDAHESRNPDATEMGPALRRDK